MAQDNYYKTFGANGYLVKSRGQGNCKIAEFVCESDADDFVIYRNKMLDKFDTSDTSKYKL